MHGIIHAELKRYVTSKMGDEGWQSLLKEAELGQRTYLTSEFYPDAEAMALVTAASSITGTPASAILEDFGEFIVPTLVTVYKPFIKPEWRTLDLLEHTEGTIHKVVRMKSPGATPPYLKASRPSPDQVVIDYSSPRKMCHVAKGIVRGVAKHYNEKISIVESECMLTGGSRCMIAVRTDGEGKRVR